MPRPPDIPKDLSETIAALATPPGEGGIGVLRLSGPQSKEILTRLWKPSELSKERSVELKPRQLHFGILSHPKTSVLLDQALVAWFPKPHSYTGEDVVEIQAHGAPLLLQKILTCLLDLGARLAEPGEFTRRAYLNGKLDLLQAEAVAELIHAKSEASLQNARSQLEGRLSQEVQSLRQSLIELLAKVEAAIDFPEEDIELIQAQQSSEAIDGLQQTLKQWQEKFQVGRLIREGVRVALVGRPNVGKSSLLNRLLGEEKAIVHNEAGTTRDVVEGWIQIKGVAFELWDTAGIRLGEGQVEALGIQRSRQRLQQADVRLWVVDGSQAWTEADQAIAEELRKNGKPTLLAANKSDLAKVLRALPDSLEKNTERDQKKSLVWLAVSAQSGAGISELKQALLEAAGLKALGERSHAYLNNARHRQALEKAQEALTRAHQALQDKLPSECVAADLREAADALGALLGKISTEDILDKIFQEFCLGK